MKDYKCPYCGADVSSGVLALAPTNLYGKEFRYAICRKCDNFLLIELDKFEFYKLPDNKEVELDAIQEFDKIITADLSQAELDLTNLLNPNEIDEQNKLH